MAVTVEQLKEYIGTKDSSDFPQECLDSAKAMVSNFIGEANVPFSVVDQAVLTVGSELFHRKSAPNGVAQFAAMDGQPIRVARDPMTSVYPMLQQFVGYAV